MSGKAFVDKLNKERDTVRAIRDDKRIKKCMAFLTGSAFQIPDIN